MSRRSLEISFSELQKYLESRGDTLDREYISDVHWQQSWPERILFVIVEELPAVEPKDSKDVKS